MTKTKSRASASERTGEGSLRVAGGFRQTRVTRGDGIVILFTNLNYVDTFSHIKHFSISFLFLVLSISILFIILSPRFFPFPAASLAKAVLSDPRYPSEPVHFGFMANVM